MANSTNLAFPSESPTLGGRSPSPSRPRLRPLARSATLGAKPLPLNRRRSSMFSETLFEARKSFRSSTDDLFLPRANGSSNLSQENEPSHWQSVPLGLALIPAVAGLVFRNGGAVATDVTLLALAAIFLNWSVRLPWDWYHTAQAKRPFAPADFTPDGTIAEEIPESEDSGPSLNQEESSPPSQQHNMNQHHRQESSIKSAQKELQKHELLALSSCFLFPLIGAWLLHEIRGKLSRPSEGLVSDYNLTVFILAAEIRPVSHLVKMVQARTLFLQRVINATLHDEDPNLDFSQVYDLLKRVEELETHVAESVETSSKAGVEATTEAAKMTAQAVVETRKCVQPEVDALNRAVRRYEKRTTISSLQTEARLQDLESRLNDMVVLAAAVQRTVEDPPRNYILVLVNWTCAMIVLPAQFTAYLVQLPINALQWTTTFFRQPFASRRAKSARMLRQDTRTKMRDKRSKLGF